MSNKIIQIQPWRDRLLALTEQGEVYDLELINDRGLALFMPRLSLLFPVTAAPAAPSAEQGRV